MTRSFVTILFAGFLAGCNGADGGGLWETFEAEVRNRDSIWIWEVLAPLDSTGEHRLGGLTLHTALVEDTVRVGSAIRLFYFVANSGVPALLNHEQAAWFEIWTVGGDSIPPAYSRGSATFSYGVRGQLVLATSGVLGQEVDLTCIPLTIYTDEAECWWGYELTEPGEYRVITNYMQTIRGMPDSVLIMRDTVPLTVVR